MYPFHRIGCRERQSAGQHFVKRDPEGIEIAARIYRPIHPSSLLGGHVGERSRDELARFRRLALAWKPRSDAKATQPHLAGIDFDEDVGWLDVFVNQAAAV